MMMKILLLVIMLFPVFGPELDAAEQGSLPTVPASGRIVVRVFDLRGRQGELRFALYHTKKGFPGKETDAFMKAVVSAGGELPEYVFEHVPFGAYAVSVRHDENRNGKLDTNVIGMPKEGVGTSNNPRTKFGPPSFDDARFDLGQSELELRIYMRYL
jgi:uncharacterized protein (DUF2141 family)